MEAPGLGTAAYSYSWVWKLFLGGLVIELNNFN